MSSTFESKHVLEHCGTLEEHDMCEFSSKTLCDAHVPKSLSELFWFYFSGLKARKEFEIEREGKRRNRKTHSRQQVVAFPFRNWGRVAFADRKGLFHVPCFATKNNGIFIGCVSRNIGKPYFSETDGRTE